MTNKDEILAAARCRSADMSDEGAFVHSFISPQWRLICNMRSSGRGSRGSLSRLGTPCGGVFLASDAPHKPWTNGRPFSREDRKGMSPLPYTNTRRT